jgi:hypothetical protein
MDRLLLMASLADPRARLARAEEHRKALDAELRAFREQHPYSIADEPQTDGWHILRIKLAEPPPRLGCIFGDWLQNLRSALDNLAHQLVLLGGGTPRGTGFPIFTNSDDFPKRGVARIRGALPQHITLIEQLQPYHGLQNPSRAALELVHRLAKLDRHAALHPTLVALAKGNPPFSIEREPIDAEFAVEIHPASGPLKDGAEIARLRFTAETPQLDVQVQGKFATEVAFGDDGLRLKALSTIGREIGRVIERFAPDFV